MAPTGWLLLLLLLLSAVGGCWGGGFGDVVGESAAPGSGEASWRIKEELGRSGLRVSFPDLVGFFVCRSVPRRGRMGSFVPWRRQVPAVRRGCLFSEAAPATATAMARVLQFGGYLTPALRNWVGDFLSVSLCCWSSHQQILER